MLLAVGVTGLAIHYALGLRWSASFLLGAILSVTDTVSILYVFRRAAVPGRLGQSPLPTKEPRWAMKASAQRRPTPPRTHA